MEPLDLRRTIAANIRRLAKERGLSLNRLADFAATSRSTFHKALAAEHAMTTDRLCRIANALEVRPWKLLADEDESELSDLSRAADE